MINTKMKPETFIAAARDSFIGSEQVYMNGSCVGFYRILKTIYPGALPFWSIESRHMISKIGKSFYDITGKVADVCPPGYKQDKAEYGSYFVAVAFPQKKHQRRRFHKLQKL